MIKKLENAYNIDTKIIIGIGVFAIVLMGYFAINMYQMVAHVGKLADSTHTMTEQMVIMGDSIKKINNNTKDMSEDTHIMSSNIDSIDKGIRTVTTPRGMMNMWRR